MRVINSGKAKSGFVIFIKILLRAAIIAAVFAYILQIRNKSCVEKENCRPFFLASEAKKFSKKLSSGGFFNKNKNSAIFSEVFVEYFGLSDKPEIEVKIARNSDLAKINQPQIIAIEVKNNSNYPIEISPAFFNDPEGDKIYITKHQCPCNQKSILDPGESKKIKIVYEVSDKVIDAGIGKIKLFFAF